MRIKKRRLFFCLLGLLLMTFGLLFAGCDASTITIGGGLILGGIIGGSAGHVFIGIIAGGIIGVIIFMGVSSENSNSSTSSRPSMGSSMRNYEESRKKDPHTCGNCTKYSSTKGECRLNGDSKSAGDSCDNWC